MAAELWLQHACYPVGCHSSCLINACHAASNTVGTSSDSCNASHTQVSVSVAETRGKLSSFSFFLVVLFLELPSGRQLAALACPHPPTHAPSGPLAVQLSLKDSSCAVVGPRRGGPRVPLRTEEPLLEPRRLCKPAVTAPCYTLVGNFEQTSSKA